MTDRPYKLQHINARVESRVVEALEAEAVRRTNRDGIEWTLSSVVRRVLVDWVDTGSRRPARFEAMPGFEMEAQ